MLTPDAAAPAEAAERADAPAESKEIMRAAAPYETCLKREPSVFLHRLRASTRQSPPPAPEHIRRSPLPARRLP